MKTQWLSSRGRIVAGACLLTVLVGAGRADAQQGQGVYVTQAAARLTKLIDAANKDGYHLRDNSFSIGGGWLKQSQTEWIALYTVQLTGGKEYRFLAAGDNDARDVDLQVLNEKKDVVAEDAAIDPTATVNFRPAATGKYTVRIRLYQSQNNLPCVCLGIMMVK